MWRDDGGICPDSAFEMVALQALLSTIVSLHTQEYDNIQSKAEYVFTRFRKMKSLSTEMQDYTRLLKVTHALAIACPTSHCIALHRIASLDSGVLTRWLF